MYATKEIHKSEKMLQKKGENKIHPEQIIHRKVIQYAKSKF